MNSNEILIHVLNQNTTQGISAAEGDILLRKLVDILTETEKQVIIKRLKDDQPGIYKRGSE